MIEPLEPQKLEGEISLDDNNIGWISYQNRMLAIGYKRADYKAFLEPLESAIREVFPGLDRHDGGFHRPDKNTSHRISIITSLDKAHLSRFFDKLLEKALINDEERTQLRHGFGIEQAPVEWRTRVLKPRNDNEMAV